MREQRMSVEYALRDEANLEDLMYPTPSYAFLLATCLVCIW